MVKLGKEEEIIIEGKREIKSKLYSIKEENKKLKNLYEIQLFKGEPEKIWVGKFSNDGKYFATGGHSGVIKIWEILLNSNNKNKIELNNKNNIINNLNFFQEDAFKIYSEHNGDITDIAWSNKNYNLLVSVSVDYCAILWDINLNNYVNIYKHDSIVASVCFFPYLNNENNDENFNFECNDFFITGGFDRKIRFWSINSYEKPFKCIFENEYITSLNFLPNGNLIVAGSSDGKISLYDINNLRYLYSFKCRNKQGKFSKGTKITNIVFKNINECIISTNDSRIRYMNINDGSLIKKFKGHINEQGIIKVTYDDNYNIIISASENEFVYLWDINNNDDIIKEFRCEYFKPFKDNKEFATYSEMVNENLLRDYNYKLRKISNNVFAKNIIVNTSINGNIQVCVNFEFF